MLGLVYLTYVEHMEADDREEFDDRLGLNQPDSEAAREIDPAERRATIAKIERWAGSSLE